MPINGCDPTLPAVLFANAGVAPGDQDATLFATAQPGPPRRASNTSHRAAATGGLSYSLRYIVAGKERRAAMRMERAETRLVHSLHHFIDRWSRRQIDDLSARDGMKLLRTVCMDAHGGGIDVEQPVMAAMLRHCLDAIKDPERLSQLYNDLAASPQTRALADLQRAELRHVANRVLDALEQALAEALAARIGTPLFGRLLKTTERTPAAAGQVRDTLEQLHGIGLWLSSPTRSAAQVLSRMLDILTDNELGRLASQAWPELSVRDEFYGAEPEAVDAAVSFSDACSGDALATWRDAIRLQLDDRKRLAAMQATRKVDWTIDGNRMGDAMRALYQHLDNAAFTLTGLSPNSSLLRARIRTEALTLVMDRLPDNWRPTVLRALQPRELTSIKTSLHVRPDMPAIEDTSVAAVVETVQADMLAADRRAVEDALAALHESIATKDRTVALTHLAALGPALRELQTTQAALNTPMPAELEASLRDAVRCMRGLLRGEHPAPDAHILRGLSDAELGRLRIAISALSSFGTLMDKQAVTAAINLRRAIPPSAHHTMDRLTQALLRADADIAEVYARLRDVTDVLLHISRRRAAMGEDVSADTNNELTHDMVWPAIERLARQAPAAAGDSVGPALERCGITGLALSELIGALADWSTGQEEAQYAHLDACTSRLMLAWYVESHMHAAIADLDVGGRAGRTVGTAGDGRNGGTSGTGGTGGSSDSSGAHGDIGVESADGIDANQPADSPRSDVMPDPGEVDAEAVRAAIAGQFGMDWDVANRAVVPCMPYAAHRQFERLLAAPPAADALRSRAIALYASDGTLSEFVASEKFARDVLDRPGMALAVEGVGPQGCAVYSGGFPADLDKDARLAAVSAAMYSLRDLAGPAMTPLTQWMHRGIPEAFAAALAASSEDVALRLPKGLRVKGPMSAPNATVFRVRREADGEYSIDTTLTWTEIRRLPLIGTSPPAMPSDTIALDPSHSRIQVAFELGADAQGVVFCLRRAIDIRYTLRTLQ